jgi:hypothetical protein
MQASRVVRWFICTMFCRNDRNQSQVFSRFSLSLSETYSNDRAGDYHCAVNRIRLQTFFLNVTQFGLSKRLLGDSRTYITTTLALSFPLAARSRSLSILF